MTIALAHVVSELVDCYMTHVFFLLQMYGIRFSSKIGTNFVGSHKYRE